MTLVTVNIFDFFIKSSSDILNQSNLRVIGIYIQYKNTITYTIKMVGF